MTDTEAVTTEIEPLSPSDPTDTTTSPESATDEELMFQAVGIIRGEVNLSVSCPTTITLNQKQDRLYPSRNLLALRGDRD